MLKWPFIILLFSCYSCQGVAPQESTENDQPNNDIEKEVKTKASSPTPAAYAFDEYVPLLVDKNIALIVNQTSEVNGVHLVDTLLSLGIEIKKVFAPEHGFRGQADAGEHVKDQNDSQTGLPIVSLYGSNKKPSKEQLAGIDLVLFDIQDVGVRFYTYISTMHYVMEACAENGIEFMVLDRPNPNGNYVDGPVLDMKFQSFVGMHPVPIVHGLTVGELAQMIVGEKWIEDSLVLHIIKAPHYSHKDVYTLPVKPSPNLPNDIAILLYPSLCLLEATNVSVGRGTYFPFQVAGYPDSSLGEFTFTPQSIEGMSKYPKHENKICYGLDLREPIMERKFTLAYFIYFHEKIPASDFYKHKDFLAKLYGNNQLVIQLENGMTEDAIRKTWEPELTQYKTKRKKYLLYPE